MPWALIAGTWALSKLAPSGARATRASAMPWVIGFAPLIIAALSVSVAKVAPAPKHFETRVILRRKEAAPLERATVRRGRPSGHPAGGTFVVTFDDGKIVEWSEREARQVIILEQGAWPP